jgi:hypothetical protein
MKRFLFNRFNRMVLFDDCSSDTGNVYVYDRPRSKWIDRLKILGKYNYNFISATAYNALIHDQVRSGSVL